MSEIRDNFCKTLDTTDIGVGGMMRKLNTLLKNRDYILWKDMEDKQLDPQYYSFRWLTLLLVQEFELQEILRIWDSFFADKNRFEYMLYFCCAMILCAKDLILGESFAENLKLLQKYPVSISINTLLSRASELLKENESFSSTTNQFGDAFEDQPPRSLSADKIVNNNNKPNDDEKIPLREMKTFEPKDVQQKESPPIQCVSESPFETKNDNHDSSAHQQRQTLWSKYSSYTGVNRIKNLWWS